MSIEKQEEEMLEAYRQLSASGRVDVLAHTKTILKAETGIKKEYGIEEKSLAAKTGRNQKTA